ncbi:sporulation membrane protein YtaF [Clostridium septicum]|uniref:Sporulation membrane protein YtaF n=1 Tax=Clostridium septicum TaxID=1504 RepID=A0A9N7JMA8_CLOSE|nr:sporulation membrane protein YtaF [Clostridium septicum]AYE35353.1 sporulation membrane protein YtaF [Clostridium septicum]MDU1315074.1 sporulation membrane protein YtaF [Clostridium septicum]QAS60744.1 sporulation membrane protein YtaF [Clostridium septicum]UEC19990.1 sporulation membrane protein YtaF [Clostridium septicum]USS01952.1 sporulation membrane protein YtaF [Clostridium septicum]
MLETLLLVLSVSIDSFVASIAYGTDKIKIPILSALIIDIVCSAMLGVSLLLGSLIKDYIPSTVAISISFLILFGLGVYRLFESIFKNYIKNKSNALKPLTFKMFDFNFVLQVYADETKADFDKSKILTSKEAFYLAFALSLDSLAVGFGSSLISVNYLQAIIFCLILGMMAILTGVYIGRKFIEKVDIDLSWLSGALLILLAIMRVI